jgi:hypothetical protein
MSLHCELHRCPAECKPSRKAVAAAVPPAVPAIRWLGSIPGTRPPRSGPGGTGAGRAGRPAGSAARRASVLPRWPGARSRCRLTAPKPTLPTQRPQRIAIHQCWPSCGRPVQQCRPYAHRRRPGPHSPLQDTHLRVAHEAGTHVGLHGTRLRRAARNRAGLRRAAGGRAGDALVRERAKLAARAVLLVVYCYYGWGL